MNDPKRPLTNSTGFRILALQGKEMNTEDGMKIINNCQKQTQSLEQMLKDNAEYIAKLQREYDTLKDMHIVVMQERDKYKAEAERLQELLNHDS
jgi:Mg2+ and Co2+ transporter CorA